MTQPSLSLFPELQPAQKTYQLRDYQQKAVDAAVSFFQDKRKKGKNGVIVLPTGAGKSLVIANIAIQLGEPVLIFQPSKEILEQNHEKLCSYGIANVGIFFRPASTNRRCAGLPLQPSEA